MYPLPCALRPSFNGDVSWDGVGAVIALVGVSEANGYIWLAGGDDSVGDADGFAVIEARAKVGMQMTGQADAGDIGG